MEQILRLPAVQQATGLAKATIYKHIAKGNFPAPVRLTPNAVGWKASDVAAWIGGRK